jgi:predicted metalloprotease with PDZ domain
MLHTPLFLCALLQGAPAVRADYTIRVSDPASRRATVAVELFDLPAGLSEVEFTLPERFAFTTFPEGQVVDPWIVVVGDRPSEVERVRPFAWKVPCAPGKPLAIVYNAPLDLRTHPLVTERGDYEMPYVAEDHALLSGGALLAAPTLDGVQFRVRFETPEGWAVHTPWPQPEPGVHTPRTALDLQNTVLALGAWTVRETTADGARAVALFAPSEVRLLDEVAPLVRDIFAREIELFGGAPLERYLFVFTPSRVRGFAGSAKQGSMVLSVGANLPTTSAKPAAAHLIAHEFFHTWGAARYACPDELRFFNEGFTDYFAYEVTRRIGATSEAEFVSEIGEKLAKYERAAAATKVSLVEASGARFFEGGAAYDQVYAGGLVIAALCEKAIKSSATAEAPARTLEQFLRAFNNDKEWSLDGAAPTLADFFRRLAEYTGDEFATAARALVETPEADLAAALLSAGCKVERTSTPAPLELRANFDGLRLVDLDPTCAAALVGLRAGDKLIEVNGVKVEKSADCGAAFAKPVESRLRITFERDGAEQRIDAALPTVERVEFGWTR